jgi:hypothetical protein
MGGSHGDRAGRGAARGKRRRYFRLPHPTLIGHNDIAPYDACFDGDDVVGVFDWDMSGPTTPLFELAFIAWNCVPLWRDIGTDPAAQRASRQNFPEVVVSRPGRGNDLREVVPIMERTVPVSDCRPLSGTPYRHVPSHPP